MLEDTGGNQLCKTLMENELQSYIGLDMQDLLISEY